MQDLVGARNVEAKTKVFISYSRKDMAFADKLEVALKARSFEPLIDRQEIYAFEDWWKRIKALIGRADTVVFVLSPDSVASDVALKEIMQAASFNKRFAPIVYRQVDDDAIPDALRRLNFIFFDDPARFEASADRLAEALRIDIEWIRQHTEFGEAARRWVAAGRQKGLLLRSPVLEEAECWDASRPPGAPEATVETRTFIAASRRATRHRRLLVQASALALVAAAIITAVAWRYQATLSQYVYLFNNVRLLTVAQESALHPRDEFRECTDCPSMIVVPAGRFTMGSRNVRGNESEYPPHNVIIAEAFSVSKFELTFAEWDACVAHGPCRSVPDHWGRGRQPVTGVNWVDAQRYAAWLSRITGKHYRLLSEAEYEYAARAGTTTKYPWGDEITLKGQAMANCIGCGSKWEGQQISPVGSFPPNGFGLYDMVGNVWEWVADCYHKNYVGAPLDGSAWDDNCALSIVRGGSWQNEPDLLRSAFRTYLMSNDPDDSSGFRLARALGP